ncbi:hypothetical protein [Ethanoligenens sp.]|uniref:hypothetical protein n=1 Tax=Ethanoligenens sp. TaxID=2099655 RepID=UPI0039ED715D
MKILLLVVLAPVLAVLTVIRGILQVFGPIIKIVSALGAVITAFIATGSLILYFVSPPKNTHGVLIGIIFLFVLVFAFSSFGIPFLSDALINWTDLLRRRIQSLYSRSFLRGWKTYESSSYEYAYESNEYADDGNPFREQSYADTAEDEPKVPECFRTLGFTQMPTEVENVTQRYRRFAKIVHPDVGGSDEEMAALNSAYHKALEFFK